MYYKCSFRLLGELTVHESTKNTFLDKYLRRYYNPRAVFKASKIKYALEIMALVYKVDTYKP